MLTKFKSLAENWVEKNKKKFPRNKNFMELTMCKRCYTFYYKHSWHFERPKQLDYYDDTTVPVYFTQCPACLEEDVAFYEREG